MARYATLKPTLVKSRRDGGFGAWCLNIPPELSSTGKRKRQFFQKKDDAFAECERLKARKDNFGISLNSLTPARIAAAAEAYTLLDPYHIDLLVAVRSHLEVVNQRTESVSLGVAFDTFLDLKSKRSPQYRKEIRQAKSTFRPLLERQVCDIKPKELLPILDRFPPSSRDAKMRRLRSVFNLSIKRGWMQVGANPIARLDFSDKSNKEVEVYSPDEIHGCSITL